MIFRDDSAFAQELDRNDPLAGFRSRFHIPTGADGNPLTYLCGHSLGLQPKTVRGHIEQELKDWERLGVEGHFQAKYPWLSYHELLTEQTARLVGALPSEVVVMNSLTTNLHLMMISFYRPSGKRTKILIEPVPFPSDRYAIESQVKLHNGDPRRDILELQPRPGETSIRQDDIEGLIRKERDTLALIMMGGVNYYSGQVFDMERIARVGQEQGCVVGFDLAHAAGNIPMKLHEWDVDFAVWCSYKYLCGGPGTIAGCFVHERHGSRSDIPRLAGWWGNDKATRFRMGPEFVPIPGAEGWQLSNPPIFQLAALRASTEIFDEAGMDAIRAKSELLTGYLEFMLGACKCDFTILTPLEPSNRGAQLSIMITGNGATVYRNLMQQGILCDWREPNVIRVAPCPLYNTFADVHRLVRIFGTVLK